MFVQQRTTRRETGERVRVKNYGWEVSRVSGVEHEDTQQRSPTQEWKKEKESRHKVHQLQAHTVNINDLATTLDSYN